MVQLSLRSAVVLSEALPALVTASHSSLLDGSLCRSAQALSPALDPLLMLLIIDYLVLDILYSLLDHTDVREDARDLGFLFLAHT